MKTAGNKRVIRTSRLWANIQSNMLGPPQKKALPINVRSGEPEWLFYVLVLIRRTKQDTNISVRVLTQLFKKPDLTSEHNHRKIHIYQKRAHSREEVGVFQTLRTLAVLMPKYHSDYNRHSRNPTSAEMHIFINDLKSPVEHVCELIDCPAGALRDFYMIQEPWARTTLLPAIVTQRTMLKCWESTFRPQHVPGYHSHPPVPNALLFQTSRSF